MTGSWRVDWLPTPTTLVPRTEWHRSKHAADLHLWRLRMNGIKRAVSWFDAAVYEGAGA